MGQPDPSNVGSPIPMEIGMRRAPGELKHLSTRRSRKSASADDSPSSGERTGRSPNPRREYSLQALRHGGCGILRAGTADPAEELQILSLAEWHGKAGHRG